MKKFILFLLVFSCIFGYAAPQYYSTQLKSIPSVSKKLMKYYNYVPWRLKMIMSPYLVIENGEGYVVHTSRYYHTNFKKFAIAVCVDSKFLNSQDIILMLPNKNFKSWHKIKIKLSDLKKTTEEQFLLCKYRHYENLLRRNSPGSAWFRHQARSAAKSYYEITKKRLKPLRSWRNRFSNRYQETFTLFSGGRALSENLQLDRILRLSPERKEQVKLKDIKGIEVEKYDWAPFLKKTKTKKDLLSYHIPEDQHALFFPNFKSMLKILDEVDRCGVPAFQLLEIKSQDELTAQKYKTQLCLENDFISRLIGSSLINSTAITGSDPYFYTGTDIAILFEAKHKSLFSTIKAKQKLALQIFPDAKVVNGKIKNIKYTGVVTPNRKVCSYAISWDNIVVVSNSLKQLEKLIAVKNKKQKALAYSPEYKFFRQRYLKKDEEDALLILTDATIRRWCNPKWRIATSRRIRAGAIISELQAANLKELVSGKVKKRKINSSYNLDNIAPLSIDKNGIQSQTYGNLDFLTPVCELEFDKVTKAEAEAYKRFSRMYQRNWRDFFDPIAIKFIVTPVKIETDICVFPLIIGSDYRELVSLSSGSTLKTDSGFPHDTIIHYVLSINPKSPLIENVKRWLFRRSRLKDPLGWLGNYFSVYADPSDLWKKIANAPDFNKIMEQEYRNLPFAVHIESKNQKKLEQFLKFVQMMVRGNWKDSSYKNYKYYSVKPYIFGNKSVEIFILPAPKALIIANNISIIKNYLDNPKPINKKWLGKNLAVELRKTFLRFIEASSRKYYKKNLKVSCWNNLPVLNEWKRLYPDQNPVDLHKKWWKVQLLCPAQGKYIWDKNYYTMQSTKLGSPVKEKTKTYPASPLDYVKNIQFGLTFEHNGLRAKILLRRKNE